MLHKYYPPWIGGIEYHVRTLCQELKPSVKLSVLVANHRMKTEISTGEGYPVIRLASLGRILSTPIAFGFHTWMEKQKADILHFHFPYPVAEWASLRLKGSHRMVVSYHSDIVRQKITAALYRPFLMRFLDRADAIIVASPQILASSPVLKKFESKCRVIPYGIDTRRFEVNPEVLEKARSIRNQYGPEPILLFVGRLVPYKGLPYLLQAMTAIPARLLIVGQGPELASLKKMQQELNLCDKISFQGSVSDGDLPAYYHASDLLVLPSVQNSEAFGLVQVEAHASGLPVVSTRLPTGVSLINLDGRTGRVVSPGSSEELREAILDLLNKPQRRSEMGEYAKARAQSEFDKKVMAEKTLSLYRALIGKG